LNSLRTSCTTAGKLNTKINRKSKWFIFNWFRLDRLLLLLPRQWNLLGSPEEPGAIHKNAKRTMPKPIELKPDGVEKSGTEHKGKALQGEEGGAANKHGMKTENDV